MRSTIFVKPSEIEKKWYLIDASGKTLGKVAVEAAKILRGKNKPEFAPHADNGDYVVIINAAKAVVSANKNLDKVYFRHSGYPSGLTRESYGKMVVRKPTFPLEHAIKGMLPKGALGNTLFSHLFVYEGEAYKQASQHPIPYEIKEAN